MDQKLTFKRLIKMKERKSKDEYKIVCTGVFGKIK